MNLKKSAKRGNFHSRGWTDSEIASKAKVATSAIQRLILA
jgi:hypothetical protein